MGISTQLHTPSTFDERVLSLIMGLSIPGSCAALLVLCAFAYTACNPKSRDHLNRVSFRLLSYALTANLVFGICFLIAATATDPSTGCTFDAFLVNFSITFSSGMFFCMALNLQLVLVHKFNGQKMEKFYVLGTLLLALACSVTPYAAGEFGWNIQDETCWFIASSPEHVFRWAFGTQSFWILLMATGEAVAFLVIVGYVLSYELTTRKFRVYSGESYEEDQRVQAAHSPIMLYRGMILRIGLYPLLSCLMTFPTAIIDIYGVKNPILTELNWRLSIADLAIYSVRPLFYSVLAATDPSFIRAIKSLRRTTMESGEMQQTAGARAVHFVAPGDLQFDTTTDDGDSDATQTQAHTTTPQTGTDFASKHGRSQSHSHRRSHERFSEPAIDEMRFAERKDVDDVTRQI